MAMLPDWRAMLLTGQPDHLVVLACSNKLQWRKLLRAFLQITNHPDYNPQPGAND